MTVLDLCLCFAVLVLGGLVLWLSQRVAALEDFDTLEADARERLGRMVTRLRARVVEPWEPDDDDDDDE